MRGLHSGLTGFRLWALQVQGWGCCMARTAIMTQTAADDDRPFFIGSVVR